LVFELLNLFYNGGCAVEFPYLAIKFIELPKLVLGRGII